MFKRVQPELPMSTRPAPSAATVVRTERQEARAALEARTHTWHRTAQSAALDDIVGEAELSGTSRDCLCAHA